MVFEFQERTIEQITADIEIVFVIDKNLDHKWVKDKETLQKLGFEGKEGESLLIPETKRLYLGVKDLHHESIRIAASSAIKALKNRKYQTAKIGTYIENCPITNIKAVVEGAILGGYGFNRFKKEKPKEYLTKIIVGYEDYSDIDFSPQNAVKSMKEAQIVAEATNYVRDLVNLPPNVITPQTLAEHALKLAEENSLECTVLDEKELEKENMNAFLAVGRASANPPRLIHLKYRPQNPKAKVAFVGKGLTYDSGGLSLKPSDYMVTMKADKSGACAVLGIIKAASEMELPVEIDAVIGAAENMVGPDSYKPDDILKAKNGKTIEVRNTDAEGRLVLADTLCYVQEKIKPDYIVDLATLTGACVVALGEYTIGVMGHDRQLQDKILKAAEASGELAAKLPFNRYLPKLLESKVADICNISSSRYGGAITAALFLSEFIEKEYKNRWVHLDIAGPAYLEKEWGYNPYGASGAGVRLGIKWLQKEYVFNKKHP